MFGSLVCAYIMHFPDLESADLSKLLRFILPVRPHLFVSPIITAPGL